MNEEQEKLEETIEILMDMVIQNCSVKQEDGTIIYDSMALSTNADAMRFLAEHGKLIIEKECGRRIIARLPRG